MEAFFWFVVVYWVGMYLSGGCAQVLSGNANANFLHLFYIGLAITGVFVLMASIYEIVELVVKNKNNTQKKE